MQLPIIIRDETRGIEIKAFNRHVESITNIKLAFMNATEEFLRTKSPRQN